MTRPKVSFLIIGAQKAGTTALDHYLRQHPEIGMADVKEVHFFDDEDAFAHAPTDHSAYEAHFCGAKRFHGETTPIYLWWKPASERIHRYNPDVKLIAVLRDPVERAFSQWNMEFNRGDETRDFRSAVEAELEQRAIDPGRQHRVFSYLSRGMYAEQIERFHRSFDPRQLLCIKYDDLRDDPLPCLHRIFDHIGVDLRLHSQTLPILNQGAYSAPLDKAQRRALIDVFAEDILRVGSLLDMDVRDWLIA